MMTPAMDWLRHLGHHHQLALLLLSYVQRAAHPLSKAAFHGEWSFTFLKLRKLQPKSCSGTASILSQKGLVGGRNGGGQVFGKHEPMTLPHHGDKDC